MVVVGIDPVLPDQLVFLGRREGELAQVAAVAVNLVEAVTDLRACLPGEDDVLRIEGEVETLDDATGQVRQEVGNRPGPQIKHGQATARLPGTIDVLGLVVIGAVGGAAHKEQFADVGGEIRTQASAAGGGREVAGPGTEVDEGTPRAGPRRRPGRGA